MPKLIALISKQPQLSPEAFQEYYEANHAPLIRRLLPTMARYTRSYLPAEPENAKRTGLANFDVLTELWFDSESDLEAFWKRINEPEVIAAIRADEAHFLISERTVMYRVDEAVTVEGQAKERVAD
jgi:uncharacterized protein (TIGR02118 family)